MTPETWRASDRLAYQVGFLIGRCLQAAAMVEEGHRSERVVAYLRAAQADSEAAALRYVPEPTPAAEAEAVRG